MTTEPPQGLKSNMKRIFTNVVDQELFNSAEISMLEAQKYREANPNQT